MTTPCLPHSHDGGLMKPVDHKPRTVPFTDITVGERHRHDLDHIDALARSISELNLLHPIAIRPDPAHRIELSIRDIAPPHEFKDFSKYLTAWLNNEPIGHINADGYRVINIEGRDYYMHDLVYAYMKGRWPNGEVEHINGNKDDNRWANLRWRSQAGAANQVSPDRVG